MQWDALFTFLKTAGENVLIAAAGDSSTSVTDLTHGDELVLDAVQVGLKAAAIVGAPASLISALAPMVLTATQTLLHLHDSPPQNPVPRPT